ncbi:hypothetical protein BU17DRAFT_102223 [Hysterangium stoloniferum]|nr:hypothetical protein BU17DRAFT_102223 [Hysterangium stoloniferum]
MGMLARLSLKEACVVSKPGSSTSTSSSTIKSEEGSEAKLKRAGFGTASTGYLAPGPASNLAPKGLGNAVPRPLFSRVGFSIFGVDLSFSNGGRYVSVSTLRIHPKPRSPHCPKRSTNGTCSSSPPTVLAISSRYLPSCPRLHDIAMNIPEYAAATAFIDGVKSVEMGGG